MVAVRSYESMCIHHMRVLRAVFACNIPTQINFVTPFSRNPRVFDSAQVKRLQLECKGVCIVRFVVVVRAIYRVGSWNEYSVLV